MTRFPMATAMTAIALLSLAEVESQTSCISKLVPCLDTLKNTTTKPSKVCCGLVKKALEKDVRCLCTINTNVATTEALNLSRRCNIHTDLTGCSAFGAPSSTASLSPSPGFGTPSRKASLPPQGQAAQAFGAPSPTASLSPSPGFGTPSRKASLPPQGQASQVKSSWKLKVILGASAAALTVIVIIVIVVVVKAHKARMENNVIIVNMRASTFNPFIWLTEYDSPMIKKMTNSFGFTLGKGSFGIVYKGTLPGSGRDVAVKVLKNPKEDRIQFTNELRSMIKTSHDNIVSLLGFCHEGNDTALVYEYMPNGSLNELISRHKESMMAWDMCYAIVMGVCRGLEYLHNGCGPRIVHFDIKPENILMDKDFRPKIADFGLATLCKAKESVMSMRDGRGTPGYMAPEMFSRDCGAISYKADVYSLGMVIFEMMGLKNRNIAADSGSSNGLTYFPDWIREDIERGRTMRMFGDQLTKEEVKIAKKMVLVGLWCIQTNPSKRPTMIKVIEMLEGDLEVINLPPKPQPLPSLPPLAVEFLKLLMRSQAPLSPLRPRRFRSTF